MPVQVTIRHVPEAVRDALAVRAARERKSMQEFLVGELERIAARPSAADWVAQARADKTYSAVTLSTDEILGHRDADRR
ncbi:MAG: hypothetical protein AAF604_11445 [Acidobacteriota bacterium]